jgi:hypothetical protein
MLAGVPVFAVVAPVIIASGLVDNFLLRFADDRGSAQSRVILFDVLDYIGVDNLWFGAPSAFTFELANLFGTDMGLENFWIAFLLFFGIVGCIIFLPFFLGYLLVLTKERGGDSWIIVAYFLGCITSAMSLASKSPLLAILTLVMLTNPKPLQQAQKGVAHV